MGPVGRLRSALGELDRRHQLEQSLVGFAILSQILFINRVQGHDIAVAVWTNFSLGHDVSVAAPANDQLYRLGDLSCYG